MRTKNKYDLKQCSENKKRTKDLRNVRSVADSSATQLWFPV